MTMKKLSLFLIILILTISLTSCWGRRELGEVSFARVTGIDIEENELIRLTVLTREPIGSSEVQATRSAMLIRSATGRTIMDARKNLLKSPGKRVIWSHNEIIVFGKAAAEVGLDRYVDYFARNREFRLDNNIIVAEGRAEELLQQPGGVQSSVADDMMAMMENSKVWSDEYVTNLKDLLIELLDKKANSVTAIIGQYISSRERISTNLESFRTFSKEPSESGKLIFKGSAFLKRGKLKGEFSPAESKGYLWITSEVKEGIIVFGDYQGGACTSIEPVKSRPEIIANIDGDKIAFTIKIEASGFLAEEVRDIRISETHVQKQIEECAAQAMIEEMEAAVKKAQKEYKVDVLDLANTIYRQHPKVWKEIEKYWDEIYPDVEIKYDVKFKLTRIGVTHDTTVIE